MALISTMIISCIPQKRLRYLQPTQSDTTLHKSAIRPPEYRIQPKDNIFIRLLSENDEITHILNNFDVRGSGTGLNWVIIGYLVSDSGYIELPVLGKFKVDNLTCRDIKDSIQNRVDQYFKGVNVVVKLVEYNFSVLGEVNKPGLYSIGRERVNIFEAIGQASDLTLYGNRKNVKIIHTTSEGTRIISVDLTDKKILDSPYYYLANNDIIYIESMKSKNFTINTFRLSEFLSIVSVAVSLLLLATIVK